MRLFDRHATAARFSCRGFSSRAGADISAAFHRSTSIKQQLAPIECALLICDLLEDSKFTQPPRSVDFPGSPTGS
jgi:hypothetical protein